MQGLPVDQTGACRQLSDRRRGQREAPGEIVAVASEEPHTGSVAPRPDAEAVVLDFVQANPSPAGGLSAGRGRHGSTKSAKGRERGRGDMRP